MKINICYFVVYFLEALIFLYYCNNLFEKKQRKWNQTVYVFIAYLIQYVFSFLHLPFINAVLFIGLNWTLLFFLYDTDILGSIFHSIVLVISMGGSELAIAPLFTNDFWKEQSQLHNLIIQAPLCKFAYFLIVIIVVHLLKCLPSKRHSYVLKENILLIITSLLSFWIIYSLIIIYSKVPLSMPHRILIMSVAFIQLLIVITASWLYDYMLLKGEEHIRLQIDYQREQDYSLYYQALIKEQDQHHIIIHDIENHLQSILALTESENTQDI